jgi:UDP-3-O-[3-hydroxymyristoyl] glucosamine N-acyltransferase
MSKFYTLKEIESYLGHYTLSGKAMVKFNDLKPLDKASENSLVFIDKHKNSKIELAKATKARQIICDFDAVDDLKSKCLIKVEEPRLVYLKIANALFKKQYSPQIHTSATIAKSAVLSPDVYIGPNTFISENVRIGESVCIHGNSYIYDNVTIKKSCVINAGAVIGFDGFGHVKNSEGIYENMPHVGGVEINENVEIGANACIASGTLSPTVIGRNTKIDVLCQIGHNVIIGENCMILAQSVVGGSTRIGSNSVVAIAAVISDNLLIEEDCHIGPNTLVLTNLKKGSKVISKTGIII